MSAAMLHGTWLVARQEFRMRLRTGRWRWLLAAWVVLLMVFTVLLNLALDNMVGYLADDSRRGVPLFGSLMMFVLGMVLVISPALTSQTINGDRERGTLATLQVTMLRPLEIALGKLLAGWGVGLVALALTVPFAGFAMANGGITLGRVAVVYAVVALLIGVVCAVAQALSALLARSITSALLSYLAVAALTVGTVIAMGLAVPLTTQTQTVRLRNGQSYTEEVSRPDRVWWLIAPNPFVVVADSAPSVPPRFTVTGERVDVDDNDPLSAIGWTVRGFRRPPYHFVCYEDPVACQAAVEARGPAVWPYGLGFNILLGIGAVAVTTQRLRTPTRRLARGVRIA